MSNTITAFLERLTAASGEYNAAKVGKLGFMGNVYVNLGTEVARDGQVIRIPFPDTGAFSDQAGTDWSPTDVDPSYVDVTFGQRPGSAILIRDFEQMQTGSDLVGSFIPSMYQRAQEYANGQIASLVTTGNFSTYPALQSSKLASVDIDTAANAWDLLVDNKVPILDPSAASLIVHNNVHRNMLTDTDWYQESLAGAAIAQGTRTRAADQAVAGAEGMAFNFGRFWDQQVTTSVTANLTGTVAATNGSAAIVGTGTSFTSQATKGSWIKIASDTPLYRVASVTDDTHLTLTQLYQGTTASGSNYKRKTYTCVAMHKYAIALAVRPLEIVNDGHVHSRLVVLNGLPIRVTITWEHTKSAYLLTMDYAMVAAVIRPDFGVVIQA